MLGSVLHRRFSWETTPASRKLLCYGIFCLSSSLNIFIACLILRKTSVKKIKYPVARKKKRLRNKEEYSF